MILTYCASLATFPEHYWTCTLLFGAPFAYICIQQIYIDHDEPWLRKDAVKKVRIAWEGGSNGNS